MLSCKLKRQLYYSFFTLQLITIAGLFFKGNIQAIYDVASVVILFSLYIYLENKYKLRISNYIRGNLLLTLTIHTFVGKFLNFYQTVAAFDNLLHIYGSYSVALFIYALSVQLLRLDFSARLNRFVFIMLIGLTSGAVYEILEFLLDVGLKPKIPNQAGLIDTDLDMLSDFIGSFAAAFHECYLKSTLRRGDDLP